MEKFKKAIIITVIVVVSAVVLFFLLGFLIVQSDNWVTNLNNDKTIPLNKNDQRTLKYSDVKEDGLYTLRIKDSRHTFWFEFTIVDKDGTVIENVGEYFSQETGNSSSCISNCIYDLKKGQKIRITFKKSEECLVSFGREIERENIKFENAEETGLDAKIDKFEMKRYYKFTPTTTGSYTFVSSGQSAIKIYNTAHEKLKEVTTFPSSIRLVGGVEYRIELPAGSYMKIVKAAENVGE